MKRSQIAAELAKRPQLTLVEDLKQYDSTSSCPRSIELKIDLPSKTVLRLPKDYDCIQDSVRQVFANYSKIKATLLHHQRTLARREASERTRLEHWVKEMDVIEVFNQDLFWKIENEEAVCLSGLEASHAQELLTIQPRFITNPSRFDEQKVEVPRKRPFCFIHAFNKVANPERAHTEYKRSQVWTLWEINQFLAKYFRSPNNFAEIAKSLPDKRIQDVIQFFYLVKYEFRLKRHLRIQARKRDDSLAEVHADKVLRKLKEKVGGIQAVSAEDLTRLMKHKKYESVEKYFTVFGKDKTKLRPSSPEYKDYCLYKERSFGGDTVQDEGPIQEADQIRPGSSQWTYHEKQQFLELFKQVGRDWQFISVQIKTKTQSQVRNYFQNYKTKLNLESFDPSLIARKTI